MTFKKPDAENWKLSDLEMKETLGTGSFGRVRLCKCRINGEYYAMKCLKKKEIIKMKQVQHTLQEREYMLEISNPFVVNMIRSFQDEQNLYMLMEYVCGGELFTHLRRAGRFPGDVARFYAAECVLIFDYLHAPPRFFVYRDLKPENLLLDGPAPNSGGSGGGHIKLIDASFMKRVTDRTFTLCGTPDYLAPEVIQSKGHGLAVDWWTLGILTYEMLAGYPPFYDDTPFRLYEKILEGKIKFPNWFDSKAKDFIKNLLITDHTKRLGTRRGGTEEVKSHPYFQGANWEKLYNRHYPAPIAIKSKGAGDTSNFENYPEPKEDKSAPLTAAQQAEFKDF